MVMTGTPELPLAESRDNGRAPPGVCGIGGWSTMRRRTFLGIVTAGAVATACGGKDPQGRRATPSSGPSPSASAATSAPGSTSPSATASRPPAGPPNWAGLAAALSGSLVLPGARQYDAARRLYNTRFDGIRPQAVARCAGPDDVVQCVRFASRYGVPLALRSGGHSYAGWSSGPGLVVDTGPMSGVTVSSGRVTVGAGTKLIDLYAGVAARGVAVAAGSCPTVGVTGLTLGGGIGVISRAWGLTCDSLLAAQVVTADGRVRAVDARREPDLYWALRGGGGGNFGVVTSLTLRTRPAPDLAMTFLRWPWARASDVVRAWQNWLPGLPDEMWSNLHLLSTPSGPPQVKVNAFHIGDPGQATALVDRLVSAVGSGPSSRSSSTKGYLAAMTQLAGCGDRTVEQCHLPTQNPQGQLARETYAAKSHVFPHPLAGPGIAALVAGVNRLQADRVAGGGGVLLDSLGGAVADLAPGATAFPHRTASATAQYIVNWSADAGAATERASLAWLRGFRESMRRHAGEGAYVNYVDPDLADWPRAYYGGNYPRLQKVKATYDPGGLFTFPQSIRPPG